MRATTQRMALLETLGKVKSAVPAKSTLPICSSVRIRAGGGQVTLTGTDLEVGLTASCKATVTRQGAVCVSPKPLEAFLKGVGAEMVTLSLVGKSRLKVETGASANTIWSTTLEGYEAQDFPLVPGVKGKAVEVTGLASVLKQVSYAMAKDETRLALYGVCFTPDNGGIALAAADGFRLAEATVKAKGQLAGKTVVPAAAVHLIEKLMPGKVSIHSGNDSISFVGEGLVLTARPIVGSYPNYKQVIPKNGSPLTVDSAALRNALKVVAVTLPDNNAVRLRIRRKTLIVSTKNAEKGETEVPVLAKGKVQSAFDANFLEALLARTSGQITLRTTNARSPGVVKHNKVIHVLMPLDVMW